MPKRVKKKRPINAEDGVPIPYSLRPLSASLWPCAQPAVARLVRPDSLVRHCTALRRARRSETVHRPYRAWVGPSTTTLARCFRKVFAFLIMSMLLVTVPVRGSLSAGGRSTTTTSSPTRRVRHRGCGCLKWRTSGSASASAARHERLAAGAGVRSLSPSWQTLSMDCAQQPASTCQG
jgi:hypothetical protein